MSAGLYNLESKEFIEISNGFIIGKGDEVDLSVAGEVEQKQAQFHVLDTGTYLLNLKTKNDVLVNMKRLPERFIIPLEDYSLVTIGEDSFIFSLHGTPKNFKINEIIESYQESAASDYDPEKLKTANLIQDEIDKLNSGLPDYLKNAEDIKVQVNDLLAKRKTYEEQIKKIGSEIEDLKEKFEANKEEINPIAKAIKAKKKDLAKILKELSHETGSSKLELDL
ncbi:MAG: hypothetical protein DRQ88_07265 [Epsilonproteobacteria bacterium]|nr:MAG: hypothetical protein DRQ89_03150 [Campylobacterota bacterium]RLA66281.1 MAG: hypothetical protein DRQ88_07265 [Campylobacterota bacterium]